MTPESVQIAAEVDQFPEWARIRMRDAIMEIASVYAVTVARTPMPRSAKPEPSMEQDSNVVSLHSYRQRTGS